MTMLRPLFAGIALSALAAALAGCQSTSDNGGSSGAVDISEAGYTLSLHLADAIGRCWFAPGDNTFAGYVYSPERNADVSRILIVNKADPTGLPVLVVQATSGSTASVYGPLTSSPAGPRIQSDVARWAKGGSSCT